MGMSETQGQGSEVCLERIWDITMIGTVYVSNCVWNGLGVRIPLPDICISFMGQYPPEHSSTYIYCMRVGLRVHVHTRT